MKIVFISFFTLLLGSSFIILMTGIFSGEITVMNLVPMSIHGAVVLMAVSIVVRNGLNISEDKLVIAIQLIGMFLILLGFGAIILQDYLSISIEIIWAAVIGVLMLFSSQYVEFYRLMRKSK